MDSRLPPGTTDLMQQIANRKLARRKELAALPVGEKLRMLEKMIADTSVISATHPAKPEHPVRLTGLAER